MSRISFDLSNFKKDLAKEVNKRYIPGFIREASRNASPKIQRAFGEAFLRTRVAQGLLGQNPGNDFLDVQAQLGFLDPESNDAVDQIKQVFEESIDLTNLDIKVRNFNVKLDITTENILSVIESTIGGTYPSVNERTGKTTTVEWLKALTEGWSTPGYSITFDFDEKFYDSRSERAVMVKGKGKEWDSEDYSKFARYGYDNFVEEAIDDATFNKLVPEIIVKEFRKVIRG